MEYAAAEPPRGHRKWKRPLRTAALATVVLLLAQSAFIIGYGLAAPTHPADVAIVLGNRVEADGTPCARLAARLACALDLYGAGYCKMILVSGGQSKNGVDEAPAMKAWLVMRGVPGDRVLTDNEGVDSRHTAVNAAKLMAENRLHGAIVVTQYWHIARTVLACWQAEITPVSSAWPRYNEIRDVYSIVRETVALPTYALHLK